MKHWIACERTGRPLQFGDGAWLRLVLLLLTLAVPTPLRAVTFERGEVSFNISGFLGIEGDYATQKYTPFMGGYYFGPGYSSLNFDFWVGDKFHTRFAFGVRPLFPNLFGASNLQWIPGVEAYGELLPASWLRIRLGQLIAPLGYWMPLHLNPTQYPMVGPPIFFEEETLPYNTAAELTVKPRLGPYLKFPITLFGGKPLFKTYTRSPVAGEPDLNQYYHWGLRFSTEIANLLTAGFSIFFSEGMALRLYNGFASFQNERFYAVVEAVGRNWGELRVVTNKGELSVNGVFGVHIQKVLPYLSFDYMHVVAQGRDYLAFGGGVDVDLADNLKWKFQGDYRMVDYLNAATPWNPRPITVRSSLLFYFK